jgi:hypothetical protein
MTNTLNTQEVITKLIREFEVDSILVAVNIGSEFTLSIAALNDIEALNLAMQILKEIIKNTGCKNPEIAPLIQLLSKILRLEVSKKEKNPFITYN